MTWYKESQIDLDDHEYSHQEDINALRGFLVENLPLKETNAFNKLLHLTQRHGRDSTALLKQLRNAYSEQQMSSILEEEHDDASHLNLSHAHDQDPSASHIVSIAEQLKELEDHFERDHFLFPSDGHK